MRPVALLVLLSALVTGCTVTVTGGGGTTTTTAAPTSAKTATTEDVAPTTEAKTTETTATFDPPALVDEGAPAQYCERTFKGALGRDMSAVVVETPAGRLTCDQAEAILFDYYTLRPDPLFGRPPLALGPLACNQASEGQLAQVVCSDEDNLIYSMWPQR
ncbi:hypothetical protein [Saccharothrix violaceirubra]|uniref:Subtilisin inhibitor-like n=1 Tax=Saccharothrix violaceirubra TaxID=413306 RepID=A0A7W7T264_9PSEU|nr:hypothetical protein [Saccharothrix violaceirubra]MBB4965184.1 hypothetical protein [Saccharothrix violaceirubra]